jgi:hypothetical protein
MKRILHGARDFGPYLLLLLLPGGSLIALAIWLFRAQPGLGSTLRSSVTKLLGHGEGKTCKL